jgi:hypothetical protein
MFKRIWCAWAVIRTGMPSWLECDRPSIVTSNFAGNAGPNAPQIVNHKPKQLGVEQIACRRMSGAPTAIQPA